MNEENLNNNLEDEQDDGRYQPSTSKESENTFENPSHDENHSDGDISGSNSNVDDMREDDLIESGELLSHKTYTQERPSILDERFGDWLSFAWQNFWNSFLVMGVFILLVATVAYVSMTFIESEGVGQIILMVFEFLIMGGFYISILQVAKGKELTLVNNFVEGFRYFFPFLLATIILQLILVIGTVAGLIALFVPGIAFIVYASIAMGLIFFVMVDEEMGIGGVFEAIPKVIDMLKGYFWEAFGVMVAIGAFYLLGIFALGIGILVTAPMSLIIWVRFYLYLKSKREFGLQHRI